jgi:hypothetical protein
LLKKIAIWVKTLPPPSRTRGARPGTSQSARKTAAMVSDQRRLGRCVTGRLLAQKRIGVGNLLVADLAVAAARKKTASSRTGRPASRAERRRR